jgi:hypothetical protein
LKIRRQRDWVFLLVDNREEVQNCSDCNDSYSGKRYSVGRPSLRFLFVCRRRLSTFYGCFVVVGVEWSVG